jgi:hypothetical protein
VGVLLGHFDEEPQQAAKPQNRHDFFGDLSSYWRMTKNKNLATLLQRLKAAQTQLIEAAASSDTLPPESVVYKISAYEGAIASIEFARDSDPTSAP